MSHRFLHRFSATMICLLMLSGATAPAALAQTPEASPVATTAPIFEETACVRELPEPLVEGESATCGTVTAPMYYDREISETVQLSVVRIMSTSDTPAGEPLVILTGGPGQPLDSVLTLFGNQAPLYQPLLEVQDVILFDQRGMGMSTPSLACPFEQQATATPVAGAPPAASPMAEMSSANALQPLLECGQQLLDSGIDPTAFTTTSNAADVNAIREALGANKVDLLGISYGSELALAVMRDYPDAIDSVILASPLPLEANFLSSQLTGFDAALKRIFAGCEDDPECAAANPDLEQSLEQVVAQLNESPLTIETKALMTGDPLEVPVDGALFLTALYTSIFVGSAIPAVPSLITTTAAGDTALLENLIPLVLLPIPSTQGALFTYVCQEEYPYTSEQEIEQDLADVDALPLLRGDDFIGATALSFVVCGEWEFPTAPESINQPVRSDIETLIFSGGFDPITPPQFADDVAANLPNSTVVDVPGLGHDPVTTGGQCTIGIAVSFLADPEAPVDAGCAADLTVDFSPEQAPGGTPAASPVASPAA